jgi:hypothetical protein
LDYASGWHRAIEAQGQYWILQPVTLRQDRFTKAIRPELRKICTLEADHCAAFRYWHSFLL